MFYHGCVHIYVEILIISITIIAYDRSERYCNLSNYIVDLLSLSAKKITFTPIDYLGLINQVSTLKRHFNIPDFYRANKISSLTVF